MVGIVDHDSVTLSFTEGRRSGAWMTSAGTGEVSDAEYRGAATSGTRFVRIFCR